jgi:hypothetical protein
MASNKNVEVIVLSNHTPGYRSEKELLRWFTSIVQPAIDRQQAKTKKKYLTNWKYTPAIYLS